MRLELSLSYDVQDEDAEAEQAVMEIMREESDRFVATVRKRLENEGVDIRRFDVKRDSVD
jgi:hypothetical protein